MIEWNGLYFRTQRMIPHPTSLILGLCGCMGNVKGSKEPHLTAIANGGSLT
jgi:hypothetical protein